MDIKNAKLKTKLFTGFAAPVLASFLLSFVFYLSVNALLEANRWVDHTHKVIEKGQRILISLVDMETGMRGFLGAGTPEFLEPYQDGQTRFSGMISDLKQTVSDNPPQVERLIKVASLQQEWLSKAAQPKIAARNTFNDSEVYFSDVADLLNDRVGKVYMDQARKLLNEFISIEQALIETRTSDAHRIATQTIRFAIFGALVLAAVVGVIASLLMRNIQQQVGGEPEEIANIARKIADGDLTIELSNNGNETGIYAAIRDMATRLKDMLSNTSNAALAQRSAAEGLAAVAEQTSQNVIEQYHSTDQVAVAIHQMQATAQEVARSTAEAADSANQANALVDEGSNKVEYTVKEIEALSMSLNQTASAVEDLANDAEKISDILDVIKHIADRTNLLALNAAIEAARAGAQGRGFAVVADEVRMLAQNTQSSTNEIETMISALQEGAKKAVSSMHAGQTQTNGIIDQTDGMKNALTDIRIAVQNINDMTTQIASAAEEQNATASEISKRAADIREQSEQTGDGAKQIASSTETLSQLANQLSEDIARFKM